MFFTVLKFPLKPFLSMRLDHTHRAIYEWPVAIHSHERFLRTRLLIDEFKKPYACRFKIFKTFFLLDFFTQKSLEHPVQNIAFGSSIGVEPQFIFRLKF